MAKSFRLERLNENIKELLSELILKEIKDPRIGFVTITAVKVAADLMTAKVYFSVMGSEKDRQESRKGLISASSFMRRVVGDQLKLHHVPDFHFIYDDSLDKAMKIEEVLKELKNEETAGPEEDESE